MLCPCAVLGHTDGLEDGDTFGRAAPSALPCMTVTCGVSSPHALSCKGECECIFKQFLQSVQNGCVFFKTALPTTLPPHYFWEAEFHKFLSNILGLLPLSLGRGGGFGFGFWDSVPRGFAMTFFSGMDLSSHSKWGFSVPVGPLQGQKIATSEGTELMSLPNQTPPTQAIGFLSTKPRDGPCAALSRSNPNSPPRGFYLGL